ncbi:hypothetical protein Glove_428g64 [Diversispora epigaea]|uniref:Uncharacterized protein n=1 Tax=Diversispora epigaea TaxID=1348612 RepID=A0A397GU02_9GLOM|nr:hypothetical protein Glove_428g64 [Diversispora epigaea]
MPKENNEFRMKEEFVTMRSHNEGLVCLDLYLGGEPIELMREDKHLEILINITKSELDEVKELELDKVEELDD